MFHCMPVQIAQEPIETWPVASAVSPRDFVRRRSSEDLIASVSR
jgi:hypothetical protein